MALRIRPWFFQKVVDQRAGPGQAMQQKSVPGLESTSALLALEAMLRVELNSSAVSAGFVKKAFATVPSGRGNVLFQSKEDPLMQAGASLKVISRDLALV